MDERYVPHSHEESNCRLARELLLDHVPIARESIHPIPTAAGDPAQDATAYEGILRRAFPDQDWPSLDLALLGLGDDGHTASLFPGDGAVLEKKRWVRSSVSPQGVRERITLTAPALDRSALKVFLVCGKGKAAILKKVLRAPGALPAQLITGPTFIIDRAAEPIDKGRP